MSLQSLKFEKNHTIHLTIFICVSYNVQGLKLSFELWYYSDFIIQNGNTGCSTVCTDNMINTIKQMDDMEIKKVSNSVGI